MNPNKALWEKGDFTQIATSMRQSGEDFVKSLGVTPSMRVMDLGCGDGTTAVPIAQTGAEVVGIPNHLYRSPNCLPDAVKSCAVRSLSRSRRAITKK